MVKNCPSKRANYYPEQSFSDQAFKFKRFSLLYETKIGPYLVLHQLLYMHQLVAGG